MCARAGVCVCAGVYVYAECVLGVCMLGVCVCALGICVLGVCVCVRCVCVCVCAAQLVESEVSQLDLEPSEFLSESFCGSIYVIVHKLPYFKYFYTSG